MKKLSLILSLITIIAFTSCSKKDADDDTQPDDSTNVTETTSLKIHIENMVDGESIMFNHKYVNAAMDTFEVSTLNYYISNLCLINSADSMIEMEDSYYLVEGNERMLVLEGIEVGDYKALTFYMGVDSVANTSTAQIGDLDPNNGMAWNWNTGYKFLKFEGKFSNTDTSGTFTFHTGGNMNYKKITIGDAGMDHDRMDKDDMSSSMDHSTMDHNMSRLADDKLFTLVKGEVLKLHIGAEVQELFKNPNTIMLGMSRSAHGHAAAPIADNYANGFFMLHHTETVE